MIAILMFLCLHGKYSVHQLESSNSIDSHDGIDTLVYFPRFFQNSGCEVNFNSGKNSKVFTGGRQSFSISNANISNCKPSSDIKKLTSWTLENATCTLPFYLISADYVLDAEFHVSSNSSTCVFIQDNILMSKVEFFIKGNIGGSTILFIDEMGDVVHQCTSGNLCSYESKIRFYMEIETTDRSDFSGSISVRTERSSHAYSECGIDVVPILEYGHLSISPGSIDVSQVNCISASDEALIRLTILFAFIILLLLIITLIAVSGIYDVCGLLGCSRHTPSNMDTESLKQDFVNIDAGEIEEVDTSDIDA